MKLKVLKANKKCPENVVFHGDNLEIMKSGAIPNNSIDMVYIDPPFCTQKKQSVKRKWSKKIHFGSYDDKFAGGIESYSLWLERRIEVIHRLLKEDGSLFLHLDRRASHYGKIVCDKVFGEGNKNSGSKYLVNEIIWCFNDKGGGSARAYKHKHHVILWYCKDKKRKFNELDRKPLAKSVEKRYGKMLDDCNGKITFKQLKKLDPVGFESRKNRIDNLDDVWMSRDRGASMNDWWDDIPVVSAKSENQISQEPFIYPTQKPIKLLSRIIKSATKEGDVVADFFCGCGVALTSADKLGRKWIGIDKSKDSIKAIRKHLAFHRNIKPEVVETSDIKRADVENMKWGEYQDWCVRQQGGIPAKVKNNGADGFMPDGSWIEVKKWKNPAGISSYRQVLEGLQKTGQAYIIADRFSSDLKEKKAQILLSKGWDLHLIPSEDLLRDLAS